ncbi:LysR substrate-binding domain-containing protein [Roseinatronobacter alkalisoli]|uniref:LysR substrate-binding domain-containing protein n=1 Tax=Roseinatronobacter alkalisoli TaxID=3028235 RepID=A0ABT5TC36_9RHOB|nr:LysR substrate-binding domain-containing protein [Roseinatronobacter sp. HJB301]MDD7972690.1 LysR substrate-binding domain-containing protein [Roseinatronobacter sp. HJB301]
MQDRINIRHIRCFLEVARQQSVKRAAEKLNIAQPAISRTLNELEEIVGQKLLERNRRGSHLTISGDNFYRQVSTGMDQLISAYSTVGNLQESGEVISIGALPTASAEFLPGIFTELRAQGFDAGIRVVQGSNKELLRMLQRGVVAFVIGRLGPPEDMAGLAFEHLYYETLECAARPEHPLLEGAGKSVTTARIASYPLILNVPETIVRTETDRQFQSAGVTAFVDVIETNSVSLARRLTLMSDRIWVVPRGVVDLDYREGKMRKINVTDWQIRGPVGMSTNPKTSVSKATKAMMNEVRRNASII